MKNTLLSIIILQHDWGLMSTYNDMIWRLGKRGLGWGKGGGGFVMDLDCVISGILERIIRGELCLGKMAVLEGCCFSGELCLRKKAVLEGCCVNGELSGEDGCIGGVLCQWGAVSEEEGCVRGVLCQWGAVSEEDGCVGGVLCQQGAVSGEGGCVGGVYKVVLKW